MEGWEVLFKNEIGKKIIEIIFLVDRSGSMKSMGNGIFEGIKNFIKEQKKNTDEHNIVTYLTIKSFDDRVEIVQKIERINITELSENDLTWDNLIPRGSTRLIDTAIETLTELREHINLSKSENITGIFALLTDGNDNMADDGRVKVLHRLVSSCRDENIECIFLGANQDAITQGSHYGFTKDQSLTYTAKKNTAESAMRSLSQNISRISTSGKKSTFTELERTSSYEK